MAFFYLVCLGYSAPDPGLNCVRRCIHDCVVHHGGPCGWAREIPFCELCCYAHCGWLPRRPPGILQVHSGPMVLLESEAFVGG